MSRDGVRVTRVESVGGEIRAVVENLTDRSGTVSLSFSPRTVGVADAGVVKHCACGRSFDAGAWCALSLVGYQSTGKHDPRDAGIELRNCPCASTIGIHVDLCALLRASRDRASPERVRVSALTAIRSYVEALFASEARFRGP